MGSDKTVHIGDRDVTIRPFNGRKVKIVTKAIRQITRKMPDLIDRTATFQRDFAQRHALVVTKDEALTIPAWHRQLGHLTDDDWKRLGGEVRMPATPEGWQIAMDVAPDVLDVAEEEVMRLLAVCVVANSDLAAANEEGDDAVDALLNKEADRLLDLGKIGQLIGLAYAARESIEEELAPYADPLRALAARVATRIQGEEFTLPMDEEEETEEEQTPATEEEPTPIATSTEQKPSSSTSSPRRTGGTNARRSTARAGAASSSSGAS